MHAPCRPPPNADAARAVAPGLSAALAPG